MILLTACKFDAVSICSVCAFFADMQRRAEKAKTLNSKQESVRIPTPFPPYGTYERLISSVCFRFFGPDDFSLPKNFYGEQGMIMRRLLKVQ